MYGFRLTPYEVESSKLGRSNAPIKGHSYFFHPSDKDSNDSQNEDYIKELLGLKKDERTFENAKDVIGYDGKANTYIESKFNKLKELNNNLVNFVINAINQLYWIKSDGPKDKEALLSGMDLMEIVDLIIPAVEGLRDIFAAALEEHYPSSVATTVMSRDIDKRKLDLEYTVGKKMKKIK